jgi:hypothetical protein
MAETQTSGAPDNPIMWNANNELVEPKAKAEADRQARIALGLEPPDSEEPDKADNPADYQTLDGQTADPLTNPMPVRADGTSVPDDSVKGSEEAAIKLAAIPDVPTEPFVLPITLPRQEAPSD